MSIRNAALHSLRKRAAVGAMAGCVLGAVLLLGVSSTATFAKPISVCPSNPHYFMYKGKPVLLITSDHHYGSTIDRDFDFVKFLNYLGENGMNLTRIYPGGYFETPDEFIRNNPLGPLPGRQILPWAKSTQTGMVPQKKILRDFLNSLDYVCMRRLIDYTAPSGTASSAMAENSKQYAFYIFHEGRGCFGAVPSGTDESD